MKNNKLSRRILLASTASLLATPLLAQQRRQRNEDDNSNPNSTFSPSELVNSGHKFFGGLARGAGEAIESATSKWGRPNAYILGQEGSGALIFGLRYGEGQLFRKRGQELKVFWQGPSLGLDAGGDGDRVMMLVYRLGNIQDFYERFGGIDGSAYFIGGFGITALVRDDMIVVPIRSGVGLRLGINVNYLKFTQQSTWNPF